MGMDNTKVTAKLPRGNPYTGTLCGYEFDHGVAKDVLLRDVKRFKWLVVENEKPAKPEPVVIALEDIDEVDYPILRKFYHAHKDDEGFPEPESQSEENLREAIREFLTPEDPDND